MVLLGVYAFLGALVLIGGSVVALAPRRYLQGLTVLIAVAAGACLLWVFLSPGVYFNYDGYFGDFWTATEAINKTRYGLQSSIDYFSPIGPVYEYVYRLWMVIDPDPATAATVLQAGALAALLSAIFGVIMLWRHVSAIGLAIIVFSIIGIAVSGRGNGELLYEMPLHYVAPYNRWGWALFLPVVFRVALPHRRDTLGDGVLGIAVALLLMLKVTYGAAALGLVLARVVLLPGAWRELPLFVLGMSVVLGAIEVLTGQVSGHLADLATTAQLPQSGLRIGKLFQQLGEAAIYALAAIVAYLATLRPSTLWADTRPLLFILLVTGAGCAVLMQNHYSVEAAVYPLLILLALEWNKALHIRTDIASFRERVLLSGTCAAILFYPGIDMSMHLGQRLQVSTNTPDPAFASTAYANLRFEPYLADTQGTLLNTVTDGRAGVIEGLQMLRAAGADAPGAGQVATLTFANPFPMLLNQPSPSGTPIWLHEGRSYSEEVFVAPDVFFAGVDYVMTAIEPNTLEEVVYAETLNTEFSVAARGDYWVLRERKAAGR